jgi:hypothetical protein
MAGFSAEQRKVQFFARKIEGAGLYCKKHRDLAFDMAKVFTIPVIPIVGRRERERNSDPRYVDGQRLLVDAMKYLARLDPIANRDAVELLSEHVRTRFRMSDSPLIPLTE